MAVGANELCIGHREQSLVINHFVVAILALGSAMALSKLPQGRPVQLLSTDRRTNNRISSVSLNRTIRSRQSMEQTSFVCRRPPLSVVFTPKWLTASEQSGLTRPVPATRMACSGKGITVLLVCENDVPFYLRTRVSSASALRAICCS
jgi:hypothetical protein